MTMTTTEKIRRGLVALGWREDNEHRARDAWKGGKVPSIDGQLKTPFGAFRFFLGSRGSLRASATGLKADSYSVRGGLVVRIIRAGAAGEAQ